MSVLAARRLGAERLRAVVEDHLAEPATWIDHVAHSADRRRFTLLHRDDELEVWLICWLDGHDTGFHDHDTSGAAIGVAAGTVSEQRLAVGGPPVAHELEAGEVVTIAPSAIHRVTHAGVGPAVTIHAYSPPLGRMGQYEVADDGTLQRFAQMEGDEGLKPVDAL